MKCLQQGDSIECENANICSRQLDLTLPVKINCSDGKIIKLFKYKTKKNAWVKIVEELNPKEHVVNSNSKLDLGVLLEADIVEVYVSKCLKIGRGSNITSTHGAQGCTSNCFTYAQIMMPFRFILDMNSKLLS